MDVSSINSKFWSFVIFIGWISGCTRFNFNHDPVIHLPSYKSFALFYGLLLILAHLIYSTVYVCETLSNLMSPIIASQLIASSVYTATWISSNTLRRMFFIFHPRLMLNAFKKIAEIEKSEISILFKHGNFEDTERSNGRFKFYLFYFFTIMVAILSGIGDWMETHFFKNEPESMDLEFALTMGYNSIILLSAMSSKLFANGFSIILGQKMIRHYKNVSHEFLQQCYNSNNNEKLSLITQMKIFSIVASKNVKSKESTNNVGEIWLRILTKFENVQELFNLYSKLAGFLLIITVIESGISCVFVSYLVATRSGSETVAWIWNNTFSIIEGFLTLYLVAATGQNVKESIKEVKIQVRKCLVELDLMRRPIGINGNYSTEDYPENLVGNHILQWDFSLSALGLFNVDNSLFTLIAGTSMTFLMFMFQLKISEDTRGLKST